MRAGRLDKWVTLSRSPELTGDSDGFFAPLDPEGVWASIQPQQSAGDGRSVFHAVTIRYHPEVTMDTRIVYVDSVRGLTRTIYVRSVQNVDEGNDEMRLSCEEIVP